jgi:putative peptidoglycan lipid II flippase
MVFKLPKLFSSSTEWLEKQQSSILSAAVIITVANIISALSGFLRTRLLISVFFDTQASKQAYEAFKIASQIPDLMFQLIVLGAISASFIPIFTHYKRESEEKAFTMTSAMMNLLMLVFAVISVIVFIYAEPFTQWRTGSAFTPDQVYIAANLTRIMLLAQFFFGVSNFLTGMLQSYQRFVVPALAPIIYNLGILLGVFLFAHVFGIYSAGIGVVLGAFLHMAIQIPMAYKLGYRYKFSFSFRHPGIKKMISMTPARTVTLGIGQVQQLANGFFSTTIGNLSYVIIDLASSVIVIPIRFFGVPIAQASLPFLSEEAAKNDLTSFRDLILKLIHQISFFAYPASVLILILRIPIVRLAFGTPNFPWATTLLTGKMIGIISLSIAAQATVQLLVRGFYALKNTRIPLYITGITVGIYVFMCWISVFYTQSGLLGMAIATSVTSFLEMFLFLYFLNVQVKGFFGKSFWIPQIKMIVASFLMTIFLYLPFRILDELIFDTSRTIELILLTITTSTIGMLVYIYFAMLFEVRELYMIQTIVGKIGSWKKTLSKSPEVLLDASSPGEEV